MRLYRINTLLLVVGISILLGGCFGGPKPEEQIYEKLEKVVSLEKDFENQQDPLIDLEKKERKVYDQIIALGLNEFDKIVKLSEEAIAIVDERETRLINEHKSIQASKEEFQKIETTINQLKDKQLKDEADELVTLMNRRYESYETLYASYKEAITYDKELYEMFKNKDLQLEDLENQIKKINETYEKVVAANDTFNSLTDQYNKAKVSFYKSAGLNVTYNNKKNETK